MAIAIALLVSDDPATTEQVSHALQDLSILPDICHQMEESIHLLNSRKFDAVIVDLQMGRQSGDVLAEVRLSPSNRTAVTFAISSSDAETTSSLRKRSSFIFERSLSARSVCGTLKSAYGLILRERRRYFRYPIAVPVTVLRQGMPEVRCHSLNVSEGGMSISTLFPLSIGEKVRVHFTLPDHRGPFLTESTICWCATGQLGIRFVSFSREPKSELQEWLSRKLEDLMPEIVAEKFRTTKRSP
jgi:CheY-like chemotaxis protein